MEKIEIIPAIVHALSIPIKIDSGNLYVATACFVAIILFLFSLLAWKKLRNTDKCVIPSKKASVAGIFELTVESILHMMEGIVGPKAKDYFPIIGASFIYILVSNLIGIIPGFVPPTSNINTNAACALCVFVYYNYVGIKRLGFIKYLKTMAGPVIWLAPLILVIEVISHIVRPVSLSIRLFGNMFGDHIVI